MTLPEGQLPDRPLRGPGKPSDHFLMLSVNSIFKVLQVPEGASPLNPSGPRR